MAKESQNEKEFVPFLDVIAGAGSVLEIGSRYGQSLLRMAHVAQPGAKIVSLELPDAGWGRPDSLPVLESVINQLAEEGYDAHLVLGDSHEDDIATTIHEMGPFDLIFIDGDHSEEGAMMDWIKYGHLGKAIGFHDVASKWGVSKVWPEIKAKHPSIEFVDYTTPEDRRMGIGLIYRVNG